MLGSARITTQQNEIIIKRNEIIGSKSAGGWNWIAAIRYGLYDHSQQLLLYIEMLEKDTNCSIQTEETNSPTEGGIEKM
jgi:hypothetical protein